MTNKDTATETATDTPPAAPPAEVEKLEEEAEKVAEKIDDPATSAAEKAKLEERLNGIEEKLDRLIASPVAPSPRRTETEPPEQVSAPPQSGSQTSDTAPAAAEEEAPKGKSPVSRAWFGSRAYD